MTPAAIAARHRTLLALAVLAALLIPLPHAWQSIWWVDAVEDLSHTFLFAGLAWWLSSESLDRGLIRAAGVALAIAVGVELVQALVGRESSIRDVVLGASGVFAALGVAAWRRGRGLGWALLAIVALAPFVVGLQSLVAQHGERRHLARLFPMLADFESTALAGWSGNSGVTLEAAERAPGHYALVVRGGTGSYPGASLTVVVADWSRVASIEWDARAEGPAPVTFVVRLDDDRSVEDDGWLGAEFVAGASWRHYEWRPATRLGSAPGRTFRMNRISSLTFYSAGPAPDRRLWLDAIRVTPAE